MHQFIRPCEPSRMISPKVASIVGVIALVAGSFVMTPELLAFAANTVASMDIVNNTIQSVDIKDGEVKTVDLGNNSVNAAKIKDGEITAADLATDSVLGGEIAANAVGASEIVGVSKLIFAECKVFKSLTVSKDGTFFDDCAIQGASAGDQVVVQINGFVSSGECFDLNRATSGTNEVTVRVTNECGFPAPHGTMRYSIIVFDPEPVRG